MSGVSHILGVILAGGSARRMGGGDKGLADLGGQPMLAHVIQRFGRQAGGLILNANGSPDRFSGFGLTVVPDTEFEGNGPMSGLIAAMAWAERASPPFLAVATVTTDVPFLPLDLIARLAAAIGEGRPVIATSGGQSHPTIGLWPCALKPKLQAALARTELSLGAFAQQHEAIAVPFPFSESGGVRIDPFFNANTPTDLDEARALIAHCL